MIKLTMTNGLVYMLPPSGLPQPEADDDEAAWQYLSEAYRAVRDAIDRFDNSYHPSYLEDFIKALSDIPEVAAVEYRDPPLSDEEVESEAEIRELDKKSHPVIY